MTNYKNQTSASAQPSKGAGRTSGSLVIMKSERPIAMKQEGYISPKGPGATLDKQTRPVRSNKILY